MINKTSSCIHKKLHSWRIESNEHMLIINFMCFQWEHFDGLPHKIKRLSHFQDSIIKRKLAYLCINKRSKQNVFQHYFQATSSNCRGLLYDYQVSGSQHFNQALGDSVWMIQQREIDLKYSFTKLHKTSYCPTPTSDDIRRMVWRIIKYLNNKVRVPKDDIGQNNIYQ